MYDPLDLKEIRISHERIKRHREFMEAHRDVGGFYGHEFSFTSCGSPSCSAGWMTVSLPEWMGGRGGARSIEFPHAGITMEAASMVLRLDMGHKGWSDSPIVDFLFFFNLNHDKTIDTTIRRLKLIENRQLRRIRALEREQYQPQPVMRANWIELRLKKRGTARQTATAT